MKIYIVSSGCVFDGGTNRHVALTEARAIELAEALVAEETIHARECGKRDLARNDACPSNLRPCRIANWDNNYDFVAVHEWEADVADPITEYYVDCGMGADRVSPEEGLAVKDWLASLKVGDEVIMVVSSGRYTSKDPAVVIGVSKRYVKAKRAVDVSGTRFSLRTGASGGPSGGGGVAVWIEPA